MIMKKRNILCVASIVFLNALGASEQSESRKQVAHHLSTACVALVADYCKPEEELDITVEHPLSDCYAQGCQPSLQGQGDFASSLSMLLRWNNISDLYGCHRLTLSLQGDEYMRITAQGSRGGDCYSNSHYYKKNNIRLYERQYDFANSRMNKFDNSKTNAMKRFIDFPYTVRSYEKEQPIDEHGITSQCTFTQTDGGKSLHIKLTHDARILAAAIDQALKKILTK